MILPFFSNLFSILQTLVNDSKPNVFFFFFFFFFSFMHFGLYTRATSGLLRGSWFSNTPMCVYMTLTNFKGSIYIVQISAFNNSQSRNMKRIPMWKKSNEDTKGLTRILCNPLLRVKLKQVMAWLHDKARGKLIPVSVNPG